MNKLKVVFLFALIASLVSCKKEDEVTDFLTSKIWRPSLTDKNPASNPNGTIAYHAVSDCEKDDYYTFGTNGKMTINYGTLKCNPNQPNTETKEYTYNRDTRELIIDHVRFSVADENEDQLKYYTVLSSSTQDEHLVFLFK